MTQLTIRLHGNIYRRSNEARLSTPEVGNTGHTNHRTNGNTITTLNYLSRQIEVLVHLKGSKLCMSASRVDTRFTCQTKQLYRALSSISLYYDSVYAMCHNVTSDMRGTDQYWQVVWGHPRVSLDCMYFDAKPIKPLFGQTWLDDFDSLCFFSVRNKISVILSNFVEAFSFTIIIVILWFMKSCVS